MDDMFSGTEGADEPCRKYHIFDMKENQRHIDYKPGIPELFSPLCDHHEIHQGLLSMERLLGYSKIMTNNDFIYAEYIENCKYLKLYIPLNISVLQNISRAVISSCCLLSRFDFACKGRAIWEIHSYACWVVYSDICIFVDFWYRLVYNESNYQIADHCLTLGSCATFAPIWMQGNHPTKGNDNISGIPHRTISHISILFIKQKNRPPCVEQQ